MHWWLIQNAVTVAALLPVVWALSYLLRWRPAIEHWLWLLLLIKLVLPPLVVLQSPSIPLQRVWTFLSSKNVEKNLPFVERIVVNRTPRSKPPEIDELVPITSMRAEERTHEVTTRVDVAMLATRVFLALWLSGIVAASFFAFRRVRSTLQLLHLSLPASSSLLLAVTRIGKHFKQRRVAVRVSDQVTSPSVIAFWNPILLWPSILGDHEIGKRFEPILAHELAHLQRGDQWVVWIELCVGILWWWNPCYWLICRKLHETRELACDAIAIQVTSGTPHEYALQLLELSSGQPKTMRPFPSYAISAVSHRSLQRRLKMVFENRLSGRTSVVGSLLVAILALPLIPAWTWADNDPKPKSLTAEVPATTVENGKKAEADNATTNKQSSSDTPATDAESAKARTRLAQLRGTLGLITQESVLKELGIETDSPEHTEIRELMKPFPIAIQQRWNNPKPEERANRVTAQEHYAKVEAEFVVELKKRLKPEQFARLQQIHWQQLGVTSFYDGEVATALGLTTKQQGKLDAADDEIATLRKELNTQRRELRSKGEDVEDNTQKIKAIGGLRTNKFLEILTAEQRQKFDELKGKPFDLPDSPPVERTSRRSGYPVRSQPGGLMGFALREPILKELAFDKDSPEAAEIRKLSEAHNQEVSQKFREMQPLARENIAEIETALRDKYNTELKKVMTPEKFARVQQIYWQASSIRALNDPEMVSLLELTKEQQEQLFQLYDELTKKRRELLNPAGGRTPGPQSEELRVQTVAVISETEAKSNQILTPGQQQKFAELQGKPFDLTLLQQQGNRRIPQLDQ